MLTIFEKEAVYREQMKFVRGMVMDFAEEIGWEPLNRGRKAHASIFGMANGLNGVIDIEIERLDWEEMPERLIADYPFTLWCSGTKMVNGKRQHLRWELCWACTYGELPTYTRRFLASAWDMLVTSSESDLVKEWAETSRKPDVPPDFGPPRDRSS